MGPVVGFSGLAKIVQIGPEGGDYAHARPRLLGNPKIPQFYPPQCGILVRQGGTRNRTIGQTDQKADAIKINEGDAATVHCLWIFVDILLFSSRVKNILQGNNSIKISIINQRIIRSFSCDQDFVNSAVFGDREEGQFFFQILQ